VIDLDTSAFVKLIWAETETKALQEYLVDAGDAPMVSSVLLVIETRRAVLRTQPNRLARADLLLGRVGQVGIGPAVVESASRLPDPMLPSLDAIHLATALVLREDLDALVTYDERLADAAGAHELPVASPV
jgi:uncharacterized protein